MIKKAERKAMFDFVRNLVQNSGNYKIKDHQLGLLLKDSNDKKYFIGLHSDKKLTKKRFDDLTTELNQKNISATHIFYKDGKTFMKRLGADANFKEDKSLSAYAGEKNKKTRDSMIHLRALEKKVLNYHPESKLAYYQPKTERIDESLRLYKLDDVLLKYSHVTGEAAYFCEDHISEDFKIAKEYNAIKENGAFDLPQYGIFLPTFPNQCKTEEEKINDCKKAEIQNNYGIDDESGIDWRKLDSGEPM